MQLADGHLLRDRRFRRPPGASQHLREPCWPRVPTVLEIKALYEEAEISGSPALRIVIRDRGPGLADEHKKMVFVPFFTTKPCGLDWG